MLQSKFSEGTKSLYMMNRLNLGFYLLHLWKASRSAISVMQVQLVSLWMGNIKFSKAVHQD